MNKMKSADLARSFRYETASQEEHVTTTTAPAWFLVRDTTMPSVSNETWLNWPPWNISDSEWMEWDIDDSRPESVYWVGYLIPVPIVLLIVYFVYMHFNRIRAECPRRYSRILKYLTNPKQYTLYSGGTRTSDCEELCDVESVHSDSYQLSNESGDIQCPLDPDSCDPSSYCEIGNASGYPVRLCSDNGAAYYEQLCTDEDLQPNSERGEPTVITTHDN